PSKTAHAIGLSSAYRDLGDLAVSAKNFDQGLQFNERALEILKNASTKDPTNRDGQVSLAAAHGDLGITYFGWASTRSSDLARCQALERAFASLSEGTSLLLTLKQAGQLTNVEDARMENYTRTLKQTEQQLTQLRTAGLCGTP